MRRLCLNQMNKFGLILVYSTFSLIFASHAFGIPTGVTITGEIQNIKVSEPSNPWSVGTITVSGIDVVIPANLVIQMPVQRYTLQELFSSAPSACKAVRQTGLARIDTCFKGQRGSVVTILANRQNSGEVIAGSVKIEKAPELLMGIVTYINYLDGYFRLNGIANDSESGVMIRINDPTSRHTIQSGKGCATLAASAVNCSPDERFPVDNENYTAAFMTGVPICIPSMRLGGKRKVAADSDGFGDPFCPKWARQPDPIINTIPAESAFNLVPIVLGESLEALGSFEVVTGDDGATVKFFSAHTVRVHSRIMTSPGNPDYMTYNLVEWDMAGYTNQRVRLRLIGFTSLTDSQLDIYALHIDRSTNQPVEFPLASTVGNPLVINKGLPPFGGSIFKIIFDVDFIAPIKANFSPCVNLARAGFNGGDLVTGGCPGGGVVDLSENFAILAPVSRDIIGRTRNKWINAIGASHDILGNDTPNGQYLSPVEIAPPDPLETNVNAVQSSFLFTGLPWNLDRRLGPLGCGKVVGDCISGSGVRLNPFPWDGGIDPRRDPLNPAAGSVPAASANDILSFVSGQPPLFLPGNVLPLPAAANSGIGVRAVVTIPAKQCLIQ